MSRYAATHPFGNVLDQWWSPEASMASGLIWGVVAMRVRMDVVVRKGVIRESEVCIALKDRLDSSTVERN